MIGWLANFFLNPYLALGGAAVASPILIHFLSKRRFVRVRWAAMQFLLEAQQKNRRRIQLEQILLLLLRTLAVLLLAFMIARPFIRPGMLSTVIGASGKSERIILLDDSYSTLHRRKGEDSSSFDQGRQAVKRLAEWIAEESPNDALSLFLTSKMQQPVLALASLSDEGLQRLREQLSTLAPSQATLRLPDVFKQTVELVRSRPNQANTAIYLLSDFQQRDWPQVSEQQENAATQAFPSLASLASSAKGQDADKIVLVNIGDADAANAAITGLRLTQPQIVAGVPARFEVDVANFGNRPIQSIDLGLSISRHRLPPVFVPKVEPWQTVSVPMEVSFPQDGADYLKIELLGGSVSADGLTLDNARSAGVDVVSSVQTLIVNGSPNNDPYRDEVYLLKTALRPPGRAASGNDLTAIEDQELGNVNLDAFHLVILANVGHLNRNAVRNLEQFVKNGGGCLIFTGDQVESDLYNRELYRDGAGLLPVVLGDVVEAPSSRGPFSITRWDESHPVMKSFVDPLASLLRQVRIVVYTNMDDRAAMPETTSTTSAPTATSTRILAWVDDAGGAPIIVEKSFGRGRCILVGTSVDQQWNDWASNFSYVPVVLELVQYLARSTSSTGSLEVGTAIALPLNDGELNPEATLQPPNYPVDPEIHLSATSTRDGTRELRYDDTAKSGIYRLRLTKLGGEPVEKIAAVNPAASESDLRQISEADLRRSLQDISFEYVSDIEQFVASAVTARQELWWPLLIGVVILLMSEQTLAWWFGTRG